MTTISVAPVIPAAARMIAYTINDEPTMHNLIEMGVTAIETDDSKLLVRLKRELGLR